jgi:hypothetical protein
MTGKTTTRKRSTRPASGNDRHRARLPIVRIGPRPLCFISRTASIVSELTSRVLAQASGVVNVLEKTTLDISAMAMKVGASPWAAAISDISRYVVPPIRTE